MRPKIKLINNSFAHAISVGNGDLLIYPKYFEWDRKLESNGDAVVITEEMWHLLPQVKENKKVGWIIEPKSINPQSYEWASQPENYNQFEFILTHNEDLLKLDSKKFVKCVLAGSWLYPHECKVYEKKKFCSIIVSEKRFTKGHILRHEIVEQFRDKIDVFGRGYKPIATVKEALQDYQFTIVIENERTNNWFTEKITNAILCGCVPIYWGAPNIEQYFDINGLFRFDSLKDFEQAFTILLNNNKTIYKMSETGINKNFELCQTKYFNTEDWLWENVLKNKGC